MQAEAALEHIKVERQELAAQAEAVLAVLVEEIIPDYRGQLTLAAEAGGLVIKVPFEAGEQAALESLFSNIQTLAPYPTPPAV
jgi:hypothetical protein